MKMEEVYMNKIDISVGVMSNLIFDPDNKTETIHPTDFLKMGAEQSRETIDEYIEKMRKELKACRLHMLIIVKSEEY